MDIEFIKQIMELVDRSKAVEFDLETEQGKLTIKKSGAFPGRVAETTGKFSPAGDSMHIKEGVGVNEKDHYDSKGSREEKDYVTISAPMVGTFYRAPAPDADPYVELNDIIEKGQPLCIIEAMKLMNEITSEVDGQIIEILVENAEPVEYGQPLFIVDTSAGES